jgi:hypothetical protein
MARHASLSARSEAPALVAGWATSKGQRTTDVAGLDGAETGDEPIIGGIPERGFGGEPLIPIFEAVAYTKDTGNGAVDHPEFQIAALPGQPVAAPDEGRVVFSGNFRSYGLLLIIEHGNGYHTLLWGFSSLDVELGDVVRAGQIIGIVKDGSSPKLHVELRRNGQPVSPEVWLAASNSGVKG